MRRLSREMALQGLFQFDFTPDLDPDRVLNAVLGEHDPIRGKVAFAYAKDLLVGTLAHLKEIDALLQQNVDGWKLERLGGTERNIMRICIFEMKFAEKEKQVDTAIAVNEALEISKLYCEDGSPKFINGILGTIARQ